MKILMLSVLLMFVVGCEKEEAVIATPTLEEPSFSYDSRLSYSNLEDALEQVTNDPVFPDVSASLNPTALSINIPGSADADINITVDGEACRPLDSSSHAVTNSLPKRPLSQSPFRRHNMKRWTLFNPHQSDFSLSQVVASWNNEAPNDSLAMGYWICSEGDNLKVGRFIEGPEFPLTPQLPTSGKALYTGYMMGFHTYYYGPKWIAVNPVLTEGIKEVGEFSGPIVLEVDFANRTIQGCVGCVENLETTGFGVDAKGQKALPTNTLYTDLSFNSTFLRPVQIADDGTFQGTDIKFRLGTPFFNLEPGEGRGTWEGRFSGLPAEDGKTPRGIAGSSYGTLVYEDGSNTKFIGTFFVSKVITEF